MKKTISFYSNTLKAIVNSAFLLALLFLWVGTSAMAGGLGDSTSTDRQSSPGPVIFEEPPQCDPVTEKLEWMGNRFVCSEDGFFENCNAQTATWGGGNCSGNAPATDHDDTRTIGNVRANYSGSATFRCTDGTLTFQSGSCVRINNPCSARNMSWGENCSGTVPATAHNAARAINNNTDGYTGNATFACDNGELGILPGATCNVIVIPPPDNCGRNTVNWGGGCSALTQPTAHNNSTPLIQNAINGFNGQARFVCNDGGYSLISGSTCEAVENCPGQQLTWGGGCRATVSTPTSSGNTRSLSSTRADYPGNATFRCDDGTFTQLPGATCTPPVVNADCSSQTVTWGSCTGTLGAVSHGLNRTASNTRPGFSGTASYTCSDGTYIQQSQNCNEDQPAPDNCGSQTVSWGSGCRGSASSTTHNNIRSVTNNRSGYSGNASFRCTDGSYQLQSGSTCTQPPSNCNARSVSWGGGNCGASFPTSSSGIIRTLTNTRTGYTGTARYRCTNGSVSLQSGSTCTQVPPSNCTNRVLSWGSGCSAASGSRSNGQSFTVNPSSTARRGFATYTCQDGDYLLGSSRCEIAFSYCENITICNAYKFIHNINPDPGGYQFWLNRANSQRWTDMDNDLGQRGMFVNEFRIGMIIDPTACNNPNTDLCAQYMRDNRITYRHISSSNTRNRFNSGISQDKFNGGTVPITSAERNIYNNLNQGIINGLGRPQRLCTRRGFLQGGWGHCD